MSAGLRALRRLSGRVLLAASHFWWHQASLGLRLQQSLPPESPFLHLRPSSYKDTDVGFRAHPDNPPRSHVKFFHLMTSASRGLAFSVGLPSPALAPLPVCALIREGARGHKCVQCQEMLELSPSRSRKSCVLRGQAGLALGLAPRRAEAPTPRTSGPSSV